jgi:hypothetical protein
MSNIDPPSSRTADWVRAHPKIATIVACLFVVGIFVVIGLREMPRVYSSDGAVSGSWVLKSVGMIAVALWAVFRGRKSMRNH